MASTNDIPLKLKGTFSQRKGTRNKKHVSGTSYEREDFKRRLLSEAMLKQSSVALIFIIGIVIAILVEMDVEITPAEKTPDEKTPDEKTPDEKTPVPLLYAYFIAGTLVVAICIGAFLNSLLISPQVEISNLVKDRDVSHERDTNSGENARSRPSSFEKMNTLTNSTWILTIIGIIVFIVFIDLTFWMKLWNVADKHGKIIALICTGILAIVLFFCFFALWNYYQMRQKCNACFNYITCQSCTNTCLSCIKC